MRSLGFKIDLRLWGSFLWTRCADEESINTLENILHNLHAQSYHKTGDLIIVRLLTIPWDRYFKFQSHCAYDRNTMENIL